MLEFIKNVNTRNRTFVSELVLNALKKTIKKRQNTNYREEYSPLKIIVKNMFFSIAIFDSP